jgi:hypothetical protein
MLSARRATLWRGCWRPRWAAALGLHRTCPSCNASCQACPGPACCWPVAVLPARWWLVRPRRACALLA